MCEGISTVLPILICPVSSGQSCLRRLFSADSPNITTVVFPALYEVRVRKPWLVRMVSALLTSGICCSSSERSSAKSELPVYMSCMWTSI